MTNTRSRSYCFTINNYTDYDIADVMILADEARYLICGFEKGEKGTDHIQGYVFFDNPIWRNSMKTKLKGYITKSKGNPQQNYDYCSKDGCYIEYGQLPKSGTATLEKIEEAMRDPLNNIHLYQQYRKTYLDIKRKQPKEQTRELILMPTSLRVKYMKSCDKTIKFCTSEDTYEDEDVLFIPNHYTLFDVEAWEAGFPPKIRRGYEIIPVDPQKIILLYEDDRELNYYKKKYIDIIDNIFYADEEFQ